MRKIRATAQNAITETLHCLERVKEKNTLEAFEYIERTLSGILSHPDSIHREIFITVHRREFPGGAVISNLSDGRDLFSILEKHSVIKELQNPEKGFIEIIGLQLTQEILRQRGICLEKLGWEKSLEHNNIVLSKIGVNQEQVRKDINDLDMHHDIQQIPLGKDNVDVTTDETVGVTTPLMSVNATKSQNRSWCSKIEELCGCFRSR